MIRVIANPAAGNGRAAKAIARARPIFLREGITDLRTTNGPGDETRLTEQAIDDGITTIITLGGDGTWGKVAGAIANAKSECRLALAAAGTGNDFAKTVGVEVRDFARVAAIARGDLDTRIDLGLVDDRPFLNVASFGFAPAVIDTMGDLTWLGGDLLYLAAAARNLFAFQPINVAIDRAPASPVLLLAVANGRHFGGSFHIAPAAQLNDGALDVVTIGDVRAPHRRALLFAAAMRGAHLLAPEVASRRVSEITLEFATPPRVEVDGDLHACAERRVRISCLPAAIRLAGSGLAPRASGDPRSAPLESAP